MTDQLPAPVLNPVDQVVVWIITGAPEHEIAQAIAAQWPTEKPKTLIAAAMKRIAAGADAEPELVRGWAFAATRHVYKEALAAGDFAAALRAIRQLTDLTAD